MLQLSLLVLLFPKIMAILSCLSIWSGPKFQTSCSLIVVLPCQQRHRVSVPKSPGSWDYPWLDMQWLCVRSQKNPAFCQAKNSLSSPDLFLSVRVLGLCNLILTSTQSCDKTVHRDVIVSYVLSVHMCGCCREHAYFSTSDFFPLGCHLWCQAYRIILLKTKCISYYQSTRRRKVPLLSSEASHLGDTTNRRKFSMH